MPVDETSVAPQKNRPNPLETLANYAAPNSDINSPDAGLTRSRGDRQRGNKPCGLDMQVLLYVVDCLLNITADH